MNNLFKEKFNEDNGYDIAHLPCSVNVTFNIDLISGVCKCETQESLLQKYSLDELIDFVKEDIVLELNDVMEPIKNLDENFILKKENIRFNADTTKEIIEKLKNELK